MDKVKEKIKKGFDPQIDILHGGDGLPDWMQYTITIMMFATLGGVLWLLFHPVLDLDETHRDLLNILLGTFIATFGKTIERSYTYTHARAHKRTHTMTAPQAAVTASRTRKRS